MDLLWFGIAVLVVRLGLAAWMDWVARRTGRRLRGVDTEARREAYRTAQTDYNTRTHNQGQGGGGLF